LNNYIRLIFAFRREISAKVRVINLQTKRVITGVAQHALNNGSSDLRILVTSQLPSHADRQPNRSFQEFSGSAGPRVGFGGGGTFTTRPVRADS